MKYIAEAATRIGMPAVGFSATALVAVPTAASARAKTSDPRNDAQGGARAWSPPV
jgi:hypothetical protein